MLTVIKADITTLQVDAIVNTKLTKGYLIPAKYVIHTVALVCYGDKSGESDLLASCYRRSLSFPSTGVYGYPVDQAAKIAVETVRVTLESCLVIEKVVFFTAFPIRIGWCMRYWFWGRRVVVRTQVITERICDD